MTTFQQFAARCKMRHDFEDQIQVRYRHPDGQDYDTWVSGLEAEHRLQAEVREQQLQTDLNQFTGQQLEQVPAGSKKSSKIIYKNGWLIAWRIYWGAM